MTFYISASADESTPVWVGPVIVVMFLAGAALSALIIYFVFMKPRRNGYTERIGNPVEMREDVRHSAPFDDHFDDDRGAGPRTDIDTRGQSGLTNEAGYGDSAQEDHYKIYQTNMAFDDSAH